MNSTKVTRRRRPCLNFGGKAAGMAKKPKKPSPERDAKHDERVAVLLSTPTLYRRLHALQFALRAVVQGGQAPPKSAEEAYQELVWLAKVELSSALPSIQELQARLRRELEALSFQAPDSGSERSRKSILRKVINQVLEPPSAALADL